VSPNFYEQENILNFIIIKNLFEVAMNHSKENCQYFRKYCDSLKVSSDAMKQKAIIALETSGELALLQSLDIPQNLLAKEYLLPSYINSHILAACKNILFWEKYDIQSTKDRFNTNLSFYAEIKRFLSHFNKE